MLWIFHLISFSKSPSLILPKLCSRIAIVLWLPLSTWSNTTADPSVPFFSWNEHSILFLETSVPLPTLGWLFWRPTAQLSPWTSLCLIPLSDPHLDPMSPSFLVDAFILVVHILQWHPEKGCLGGKFLETARVWKPLYSTFTLDW